MSAPDGDLWNLKQTRDLLVGERLCWRGTAVRFWRVCRSCRSILIGADSDRIEDLWNTIYRADFYRGGVLMSALAGIDQA